MPDYNDHYNFISHLDSTASIAPYRLSILCTTVVYCQRINKWK